MTYSNKAVGNSFERDLCASLAAYGFWTHRMAQTAQGQPFDVLAARNGHCYPIDCKDCANNVFAANRIEENQHNAMQLWADTGNGSSWFALRLKNGEVYMVSFSALVVNQKPTYNEEAIKAIGVPLGKWVERWTS